MRNRVAFILLVIFMTLFSGCKNNQTPFPVYLDSFTQFSDEACRKIHAKDDMVWLNQAHVKLNAGSGISYIHTQVWALER